MIQKLFSSQSKSVTGAALILSAASFLSRLIGVLRDRIFADRFGAGNTLDVYYAAFRIPDLVYNLIIVGALSAGFIPVFMEVWIKDKKKALDITNGLISILALSLIVVCTALFFLTPRLVHLLVPGFGPGQIDQTIALTRIMLVSPIILGLSGIASGVLQSLKCFFVYSLTPIVYNLGIILGAIFLVPVLGMQGLAYGVLLGATLHLAIQIPVLIQHGFRLHPSLPFADSYVRKIGKLMIPRTLTLATGQLNFLIITIIASTLPEGSLTIFNFANNLQYFPVGIIGISFALATFPTLSQLFAEKKPTEFVQQISNTVRQIIFFIMPLTVIFLLLRAQIVRVALGAGKFDWTATITTADTLALFSLSLFAQALIPLLTRAFYAIHNTFTPLLIAFISVLINIIGSLALKESMGVAGLALAFSVAAIFQLTVLWISLRVITQKLDESNLLHPIYKIVVASLCMAAAVQFLKEYTGPMLDMTRFWGIFIQGVIAGLGGLLVYVCTCRLLRLEEITHLYITCKTKLFNIKNIQADIIEVDEI